MPRDLLVEAFKLKNVFDSIETQSQLLLSAADQIVFGPDLGDLSELSDEDCYWQAMGKVTQWQRRWTNIPIVLNKDGLELAAFNALVHPHFITYGGEYYCYLFAKQKAKEIWERHFSGETPLSRQGGIVLRHSMLALGSAREPTRILEDLLC
jgi:Zn-dependent oligopeptidase